MPDTKTEVRMAMLAARDELVAEICAAVVAAVTQATNDPQQLVGADEAGRRLGMSASAVRKAAERGTLPCHRIGRRLRFRVGDLRAIGAPSHPSRSF